MQISINKNIINKPEVFPVKENGSFENMDISRQEVADFINKGYAICCQLKGERKKENFLSSGFIGIDIDENWTLEEALKDSFIQENAAIIYTTANHRKDGNGDKFRILFELTQPSQSKEEHEKLISKLLRKYPQADQACSDCSRVFYGSEGSNPIVLDGYLDVNSLPEETPPLESQEEEEKEKELIPTGLNVSFDDVREMLTFIPAYGIPYSEWRNVCFALSNYFGDVGFPLAEEWGIGKDPSHAKDLFRRSDGRVKIGTVLYLASKYGYKIPEKVKNLRTSGQVALEDIFDNGQDYITLGDEIHHYKKGCYVQIDSGYYQHEIAKYFNKYPTDKKGKKDFAKASAVKEALKFVKAMTYKDVDSINPAGINLKNGYLKLSYNKNKEPIFELVEHSPENIFTYKADFDYKPDCDTTFLQEALDNILDRMPDAKISEDRVQQKILLGVLAASLDLQEVRKRKGRSIRLLLLIGEGCNGKDTLKTWITLLYGKHGVTIVSLGAFHAADRGRTFSLYPLLSSKVNWSSENQKIKFDSCQTLKCFITGDEITLEKKFKDPFDIKPKAIGLFNLNEDPIFENDSEAITGRYGILRFESIFKSSPNPEKPWEVKGDPRFKEDEDFIKENILPALLNLMIDRFKEILVDEIDYKATDKYLQDIRESVNHLNEFIREYNIEKCAVDDGISPRDFYEEYYLPWCYQKDLIDYSENSDGKEIIIYNDPNKYDRIVRGYRQITPALKKIFPNLQEKRVPEGNTLGIKIKGPKLPDNDVY